MHSAPGPDTHRSSKLIPLAAFDVLAQDIEFGHKEFDYTRNGGGRDFRIQRWVS